MIRVVINGSKGAMGKILCEMVNDSDEFSLVAGVDRSIDGSENYTGYADLGRVNEDFDVLIDFSHYTQMPVLFNFLSQKKVPAVIATTGLSEKDEEELRKISNSMPVFRSRNFSVGINLLASILRQSSDILKSFDVEIIEKHHNKKVDSPSGTAFLLAEAVNQDDSYSYVHGRYGRDQKRNKTDIGIHSVRGGTIVGEHTVILAGEDEVIELTHSAGSKKVFAKGALLGAKYIFGKENGFYRMDDLFTTGR